MPGGVFPGARHHIGLDGPNEVHGINWSAPNAHGLVFVAPCVDERLFIRPIPFVDQTDLGFLDESQFATIVGALEFVPSSIGKCLRSPDTTGAYMTWDGNDGGSGDFMYPEVTASANTRPRRALVSCWIKVEDSAGTSTRGIWGITNVALNDRGNFTRWHMVDDSIDTLWRGGNGVISYIATEGEWFHLISEFVRDNTTTANSKQRQYINGVLEGDDTGQPSSTADIDIVTIGDANGASSSGSVFIKDFRIYFDPFGDVSGTGTEVTERADFMRRLYDPQTRWDIYNPIVPQTWPYFVSAAGITGTGLFNAAVVTMASSGAQEHTGTAAFDAAAETMAASGAQEHTGTGTFNAAVETMVSSGVQTHSGTAAFNAVAEVMVATGSVGGNISGTGTFNAATETMVGVGVQTHSGSAVFNVLAEVMAASGSVGGGISGTGTFNAAAETMAASGAQVHTGTAAFNALAAIMAAAGQVPITGTATFNAQIVTIDASGNVTSLTPAQAAVAVSDAEVTLVVVTDSEV